MKKISCSIFFSVFLLLLSCDAPITSKEELIAMNLKLTAPNNNWSNVKSQSALYTLKTLINGSLVSEETKILSQERPNFQKITSLKNDTIVNMTITNNEGSNFLKFDRGAFLGISSVPTETLYLSPILALKNGAQDYMLLDSIWNGTPSFFLKSEKKKDTYIFDKESIFLVAYLSESSYGKSTTTFEDYREADGFIVPFKKTMTIESAGYSQQYTYEKRNFNERFPEDYFQLKDAWKTLAIGSKAPSFNLPMVSDGDTMVSGSVLEGKTTLLDFWATWCKPCIKEFPTIAEQYEKYKDSGFQVISISVDKGIDAPRSYLEKKPFPWETSLYSAGEFGSELAKSYQLVALPKPILIDDQGKIIAMDAALRGGKLEAVLEKIFLTQERQ